MPPKNLRRPKAGANAVPRRRLRRPAAVEEVDPPEIPPGEGWIKRGDWKPSQIALGKAILAKVWYCGEEGRLHAELGTKHGTSKVNG